MSASGGVVSLAYGKDSVLPARPWTSGGIKPADIRGIDDLPLPAAPTEDGCASRSGKSMMTSSGALTERVASPGTRVAPRAVRLGLWYDRETCIQTNAVDGRQKIWGGMGDGDWIGVFLGPRRSAARRASAGRVRRSNRIQKQLWFSSFPHERRPLPAYVELIRRRKLRFLRVDILRRSSFLRVISSTVESALPMTSVFTSSETLHVLQRETIEGASTARSSTSTATLSEPSSLRSVRHTSGRHIAEEFGFVEVVDAGRRRQYPRVNRDTW